MPILPLFLILFMTIPLIEIYLLIEVGSLWGALPTIFAVLFTAVLGITLIRIQGLTTLQKAQKSMSQGISPATEMLEGVLLLLAAICLLIPGFFTDTLGFLLLVPFIRIFLIRLFATRLAVRASHFNHQNSSQTHFFEGEYEDVSHTNEAIHHSVKQPKLANIIEGELDQSETLKK
jgi:UPF0716 protein FxsA